MLVYDANEEYFAQPVTKPYARPRPAEGDWVYGRVASEDGQTWLQYWLFFAYNPQDRGIFHAGRHAGDWELVQLRLGEDGRPDLATLSQHSWAQGCGWGELEVSEGEAPIVYVANGSHALYAHPGVGDRPFPDPDDEADGDGARCDRRWSEFGARTRHGSNSIGAGVPAARGSFPASNRARWAHGFNRRTLGARRRASTTSVPVLAAPVHRAGGGPGRRSLSPCSCPSSRPC